MSNTAGRAPWTYVCEGDSDGEQVGCDYTIYDADWNELATAPNERVGKLIAAAPSLLSMVKQYAGEYSCQCDAGMDRETGDVPPDTNAKNFYGEPVWANEVCDHCKAKQLLAQLAEPQVFWRAPSPDAVYTLEADLKRAVEDRAKLLTLAKDVEVLLGTMPPVPGWEDRLTTAMLRTIEVRAEVEGGER